MNTSALSTLADTNLLANDVRCHACGHPLPGSTRIEKFWTPASSWIVAECPSCSLYTPFRLEKEATA